VERLVKAPRTLRVLGVIAGLAVFALIVTNRPVVVDGYQLGSRADCTTFACDRYVATATDWLDHAAPAQRSITSAELWTLKDVVMVRSGGRDFVVVLRLADGTARAVVVGCGVGVDPDTCFVNDGSPYR